jgi:antitoxin component YwqK of YwqJK toxin-antitoxin module
MNMKRIALSAVFSISLLVLAAQDEVNPNGFNRFYHKDGKVSSEGMMRDGKPDGYWKTFYENGTLKSEGNRKNFELDSIWTFYDDSGKVFLQVEYRFGKKNGIRRTVYPDEIIEDWFVNDVKQGLTAYYYPDGKLKRNVNFIDGLEEGLSKEYAPDGRVIKLVTYLKGYITDIENINRLDAKGKKQGKWVFFYDEGSVRLEGTYRNDLENGYFKEYSRDGNLVSTTKYIDGVLQESPEELAKLDIKTDYYPDGKVKIVASYKDGVPEGVRREYSPEGEIVKSYVFKSGNVVGTGIVDAGGQRDGAWKEYYTDGALRAEGTYSKGKRMGAWKFYHKNGQLEQTGNYNENGKEDGTWTWFFDNGNLLREENYINGLRDGHSVEFDEAGKVIAEGDYLEDNREGKWTYDTGDQLEKGSFLNDMMHGPWKVYYPEGNLSFEGEFIEDNPDRKHTWYWPNGNKKLEGTYINGLKDGEWVRYHEDGTPFISIYYQNGREIRYDGVAVDVESEP